MSDDPRDNQPPADVNHDLLDTAGHVNADHPCHHCGYNVRTLHWSGNCPECGEPVADSIRPLQLRYAAPAWIARIEIGARLLTAAAGLAAVSIGLLTVTALITACYMLSGAREPAMAMALAPVAACLLIPAGLIALIGAFPLSSTNKRWRRSDSDLRTRALVRYPAFVLIGSCLLAVIAPVFALQICSALLATVVAFIVLPFTAVRHLAEMMRRGPEPNVAAGRDRVLIAQAAALVVGLISFPAALAPNAATALICVLLLLTVAEVYLVLLARFCGRASSQLEQALNDARQRQEAAQNKPQPLNPSLP